MKTCAKLCSTVAIVTLVLLVIISHEDHQTSAMVNLHKRSFASLGCMGVYDKSKFARLDRVCEECYQMFREPDIHTVCRRNCFQNEIFVKCTEALLLTSEEPKLKSYVNLLSTGQ